MRFFLSSLALVSCLRADVDDFDSLDDLFHEFEMIVDSQPQAPQAPEVPQITSPQLSTQPTKVPPKTAIKAGHKASNYGCISAEALILNAGYNGLEYGDRTQVSSKILSHHFQSLPRPYNVGVRGDIGMEFGHIGWTINACGLHFSHNASQTLNAESGSTIFLTYSSNYNAESPASLAGGKQKGQSSLNLNIGDLLMSKFLFKDKHYKLGMDAGFRYVNLHQRLNVYNDNSDSLLEVLVGTNTIKNTDKLSAYGLLLRIHNQFYFTKRFSLDLMGAISGVYGQEVIKNKAQASPLVSFSAYDGSSFHQYDHKVMPIVEFEAQFAYEHSFFDDAFSFKIKAGYLLMDFIGAFNGIKVAYVPQSQFQIETTSRFSADTFIQGATAGLELRF